MNKNQLAQELKQKLKLGIKPSDLKKQGKNSQLLTPPDSPVLKPKQIPTPPPTPPLKPTKKDISPSPIVQIPDSPLLKPTKPSKPANNLKELQEQVRYWSKTAQNHLLNLSKTSAELFNAEERIKELEKATIRPKSPSKNTIKEQPETVSEVAEQALIEANSKIRKLIKTNEELQTKNEQLNKTMQEAKNKEEPTQETFTCSDCQQEWDTEFIRLIDKQGNKLCLDCIESMLEQASQATGKTIQLETEEAKEPQPTKPCQFCRQLKSELKPRHITNLPNHDPREIALLCQDCLTYRAIKADYYCPLTSEGRDTYEGNEFDCYCPNERRTY